MFTATDVTASAANLFAVDQAAYVQALDKAEARALHSYFVQYILVDGETGYSVVDEGDYGALPGHLADRVIDSIPGRMSDEI